MSREAMQLALEALENAGEAVYARGGIAAVGSLNIAAQALRKALEKKQEPVAWMYTSQWKGNERFITTYQSELTTYKADKVWPLYTAPPKREWVDLTDDEIEDIYFDKFSMSELEGFARSIEQALKEKNK